VNGGIGDDHVDGGDDDDTVVGGAGADTVCGGAGRDLVNAGDGDDSVMADADSATDRYFGGTGDDIISYAEFGTAVIVDLSRGRARGGESGNDMLRDFEDASGGGGADRIIGNAEANVLRGAAGRDRIEGLGGDDVLEGGDGEDRLEGGAGNDTLIGGGGIDRLAGGSGADVFLFGPGDAPVGAARERVEDFTSGIDRIDLSGIDADAAEAGDQAFSMVARFTGNAGELTFWRGFLSGDTDGDAVADVSFQLRGISVLTSGDIIL
jgi:serralysin